MDLRWATRYVTDRSHIGYTFLYISQLPSSNLPTCDLVTTMPQFGCEKLFHQSEERNPVVSLASHLWRVTSRIFAHQEGSHLWPFVAGAQYVILEKKNEITIFIENWVLNIISTPVILFENKIIITKIHEKMILGSFNVPPPFSNKAERWEF